MHSRSSASEDGASAGSSSPKGVSRPSGRVPRRGVSRPGPTVVAIDGPAGSGKSSVARAAAARLGFAFLDTGASYRAVAWHGLETGADLEDPDIVLGLVDSAEVRSALDPAERWVRVGETDVTDAIREPRVSAATTFVARNQAALWNISTGSNSSPDFCTTSIG